MSRRASLAGRTAAATCAAVGLVAPLAASAQESPSTVPPIQAGAASTLPGGVIGAGDAATTLAPLDAGPTSAPAMTPTTPTTPTTVGATATSAPAVTITLAATTTAPKKQIVVIKGRGYGHGRGLGQWGAYGYAKDYGWGYRQILDHFYGGTVGGKVSPKSVIGVRLTALDNKALVVYQPRGLLSIVPGGQGATAAGAPGSPGVVGAGTTAGSAPALGPLAPAPASGTPTSAVAAAANTVPHGAISAVVPPTVRVGGPVAVRIQKSAAGFTVSDATSCSGPWIARSGVVAVEYLTITASPSADAALATTGVDDPDAMLQICSGSQRLVYRGDLLAADGKPGQRTVNIVGLDAYLRGVVPREISASWGDRAMEAVKAQAVAARSYAAAELRNGYSNTCDTISCQVYKGRGVYGPKGFTSMEDPRTDRAIALTADEVRVNPRTGAPVRTEFSASTGGFSAGGLFPSVPDAGDATVDNPAHSWSVRLAAAKFETAKLGRLLGVSVAKRDGNGDGGGRVLLVVFTYANGSVTRTGLELMQSFKLRSTYFEVSLVAEGGEDITQAVSGSEALTGDAAVVAAAASSNGDAAPLAAGATPTTKAKSTKTTTTRVVAKKAKAMSTKPTVVVQAATGTATLNTTAAGGAVGAPTTTKKRS